VWDDVFEYRLPWQAAASIAVFVLAALPLLTGCVVFFWVLWYFLSYLGKKLIVLFLCVDYYSGADHVDHSGADHVDHYAA
jgi:hypothetical protein